MKNNTPHRKGRGIKNSSHPRKKHLPAEKKRGTEHNQYHHKRRRDRRPEAHAPALAWKIAAVKAAGIPTSASVAASSSVARSISGTIPLAVSARGTARPASTGNLKEPEHLHPDGEACPVKAPNKNCRKLSGSHLTDDAT